MLTRGTQNCAYPMEHDTPLIAYVAARCDILGTQELRHRNNDPIDIRKLLGPTWASDQDASSGTKSATSISWRKTVTARRTLGLTELMTKLQLRRGRRIQMRYYDEVVTIDPDTGGVCHEIAAHLPLPSTGVQSFALKVLRARVAFINRLRPHHGWCVYTDANMDIRKLARQLGGVAIAAEGRQIVGLILSKNMMRSHRHVDNTVVTNGWTDHPFVSCRAEAPAIRRKR